MVATMVYVNSLIPKPKGVSDETLLRPGTCALACWIALEWANADYELQKVDYADPENVFIVFVAGPPRKPKRPFADWYSTYARSFSKAACSFPTRKSCALLPIASAILQNGAIRFVWQSLPPHQSTPVPTKQMPYPCNHRQQGLFVPHQDYLAHVPRLAGSLFYP